jgi:hypothetical protein
VGRIPEHRVEALRNAVVLGMGLRPPGRGAGHAPPLSAHDARVDETMGWVEERGGWPTTEQQVGPSRRRILLQRELPGAGVSRTPFDTFNGKAVQRIGDGGGMRKPTPCHDCVAALRPRVGIASGEAVAFYQQSLNV